MQLNRQHNPDIPKGISARLGSMTAALLLLTALLLLSGPAQAFFVQCPGDDDGDSVPETVDPTRQVNCMHLVSGDGYARMSDFVDQYIFGFRDVTGEPLDNIMQTQLKMEWPAPTIIADEGDEFYLNLSNVGMANRPDLFDPHTVHWHGIPQASAIYDGLPESGLAIGMFSTLAYHYNVVEPGTFMYHCHVEAVEHMQMGMLGSLYVRPAQNRLPNNTDLNGFTHTNGDFNVAPALDDPTVGDMYAYNDGDGTTNYDQEIAIQMGGFDPAFHNANENVQPLPFATIDDTYTMLNGRGYPDTVNTGSLTNTKNNYAAQKVHSLVEANVGDRILVRLSNLNISHFWTLSVLGIPMQVVGRDAVLLREDDTMNNLYYTTHSVTLGGGQAMDIILDLTGVAPGTYPMYGANLENLSTPTGDFGGMMTEIRVN